jgi:Tfp pilus assembly protein PilO
MNPELHDMLSWLQVSSLLLIILLLIHLLVTRSWFRKLSKQLDEIKASLNRGSRSGYPE